jgi:putative membrane protein
LQPIGPFLLYFGVALVFEAIFIALYMAVTPHHEATLIKQGNAAAAISLGGAVLGFTLPLASSIIHSVSLLDMAVWSVVALLVQLAVYRLVDFCCVKFHAISRRATSLLPRSSPSLPSPSA